MSNAHNEHEAAIKTPKQLIIAVLAGFLVPIIVITLLVLYAASGPQVGVDSQNQSPDAIAARIRPISDKDFTLQDVNAPKVLQTGEVIYQSTCVACHGSGAAGAPKVGEASAWSGRMAQGLDMLVSHAINGLRAMPAKGGNPDLDNIEIARAVVFMANQSGAKFNEPSSAPSK